MTSVKRIVVVAGVIEKEGKYLLAQRLDSASQGGLWEFPGGKIEANESPEQALERELMEELAITIKTQQWLADSVFDYGDKIVELKGYLTHWCEGEIVLNTHQAMVWVTLAEFQHYALCPADYPILSALERQYAVS
ncbi:(deoxy)nucleoside triphosphate pyrophosphohydrolase [Photobacterium lucens]|uniref:(deoxy)nucleoside triphosphate pyrophosphohydrolase n=1 Tax=Photobacterium lucens TaxID=2562949 RepID=UPI0013692D0B|nr:(deoxy)nucleoside triphosphate pyrophosphohydrolase [Photobacterium lucens]MBP2698892.1 (deoxy)nucleoside triphosphate pyrophosphohydrolase [Vibrio parahaemolyticus]MZG55389.1 (deoxy)nucleoside triphosphate pyrophosphohydrolase [Photobacterium lucens]MZG80323.1 (deoxy)nucleoside triphosphate pyrophosphohydrolase [Photobacterium lucens]